MNKTEIIKFFSRFDKMWLGFVLALLVPVFTLFVVYLNSFENYSVREFFHFLIAMRVISKLLSLCVLPNLGLFFLYIWSDFLKGAKGVLAATFLITVLILIHQYFF